MASKSTGGRPTPSGGRVTPKGGPQRPARRRHDQGGSTGTTDWAAETARATGSSRRTAKASPWWWPLLMFGLLGIGVLLIVLDYAGVLPGTPNNWMLLPAIACVGGGLFAAMGYR